MYWKLVALVFVCTAVVSVPMAEAQTQGNPNTPNASTLTRFERDARALRRKVDRNPLPLYIVECESHGSLRAQNSSGAGGRYQIMPSTWEANLPRPRPVKLAGGDHGPTWSSRLLQDIVAHKVARSSGLGAWSCA